MEPPAATLGQLTRASKRFARQLLIVGENRLELLLVEAQEERAHRLHTLWLAVGVAVCGFFALLALNAAIVVALWPYSPVLVLIVLVTLYAAGAVGLCLRLSRLRQDWKMFPGTLDQLRKDRACLEENLT